MLRDRPWATHYDADREQHADTFDPPNAVLTTHQRELRWRGRSEPEVRAEMDEAVRRSRAPSAIMRRIHRARRLGLR